MLVEANSLLTIRKLNASVGEAWPQNCIVSDATVSRALAGQLLMVKLAGNIPVAGNSIQVEDSRVEFFHWMYQDGLNRRIIYVDETEYSLYKKRAFNRAPVGQRVVAGQ